jgi:hypothetical protein
MQHSLKTKDARAVLHARSKTFIFTPFKKSVLRE